MDVRELEALAAIVRLGGFTRAAAALHISQPALSRRIGLLERELGRPLFERGRGRARLSDAGRTLLPHAEAALASLRDGAAAVQALTRGEAGTVTLAIVGTLADTSVTGHLRRFRAANPRVRLLLRTGNSSEVSGLVRHGEALLGLRYHADPGADLVSLPLWKEPMVVVGAATHPCARRRRVRVQSLRGETWLTFPPRRGGAGDSFALTLEQRLAGAGLEGAETVLIDSLTAQKRLVEAGFGIALVPSSGVQDELRRGTLRVIEVPALRATMPVVLIHRRGAYLEGAARRLMATLSRDPRDRRYSSAPDGPGRTARGRRTRA